MSDGYLENVSNTRLSRRETMRIFNTLILALLFASPVFAQRQAEVIVTSTFLRKLPDTTSEKVQTVTKGEKITLEKTQETNGWYYVSVANRTIKGWIRKDTVGSLTKAETIKQTPLPVAATTPAKSSPTVAATSVKPAANIGTTPAVVPPTTPAVIPNPPEPEEVLRIDTEEVNLNVRVVDDKNRTVRNLNQSQVKIYEDDVLQPITSLTTAEVPVINALVIDNSRSLRTQLAKIIEAGKIIVATNRPNDESAVVRFVSKDKIEVVRDFTSNKNSLANALDNLFVEGGQTAIIDAVYRTAKKVEEYQKSQKKEDIKLRALILVSDGDDRSSSYNEQQLFDLLRGSQVQIYAVGFVNNLSSQPDADGINRRGKAEAFLTRLTRETGGKVYFPNSIEELAQIASDISGEMRTQFQVSYTPTNENRDGTFRRIKVEIADGANKEKRIAITRAGRTVAPK
jgi:Ca-activated chloride channel family protein